MLKRSSGRIAARWLVSAMSLAAMPDRLVSAAPQFAGEVTEFDIRVNGVPLRARAIRVALPRQALVAALLREWTEMAAGPPLHVETVQRTILGRQVGFLHETVTLKAIDAQQTEVHMAVRDLRQPVAAQPRLPIVLPRSLSLLSVVEQGAGRGAAQTVSLSSRIAVSHTLTAFATALRAAGWSLSPAFRAPSQRGVVLWATREDRQMQAVVVPSGEGSTVIAQVSVHAR